MDEDGLPIVGPGVDYSKVGPIHQKRTLAFLNHFLIRTTAFLNHFAAVCDEKLEDLLIRIQRLEASMCILEAKLASIPGLDNVTAESQTSTDTAPTATQDNTISKEAEKVTTDGSAQTFVDSASPPLPPPSEPAVSSSVPTMTISKDPRFAKYFKMLNVGIPAEAVKIKMKSEGVDPEILSDPNAPAPPMPEDTRSTMTEDSDSENSSFSD